MPSIAACIFVKLDLISGQLTTPVEKVYFYYNHLDYYPGSYCLVHNSRDFGIVRVLRNIDETTPGAADKVTNCLLDNLIFDANSFAKQRNALNELKTRAQAARLDRQVDEQIRAAVALTKDCEDEDH